MSLAEYRGPLDIRASIACSRFKKQLVRRSLADGNIRASNYYVRATAVERWSCEPLAVGPLGRLEIALTTHSRNTRAGRIRETFQVAVSVCPAFNSATISSASPENSAWTW